MRSFSDTFRNFHLPAAKLMLMKHQVALVNSET